MEIAELSISTARRSELKPITRCISELIQRQGWQNGVLTLYCPHTTAGITINEQADPDVATDMTWFLDRLVPDSPQFCHGEGNSDAHIKASLIGSSVQVIVRHGKLWLGTWQGIYFCEFDGPRHRQIRLAFS